MTSKTQRSKDTHALTAAKAAAGLTYAVGRVDHALLAARLAEIPADTRTLTQRICGDPLPGRSALSKAPPKGQQQ